MLKADNINKETPVSTQQTEPEKTSEEQILSRKRRMALVSYLAILFAVAFLLVAISMVIENRQLQNSKGTLNTRIQQLQEDNEQFQKNIKDITAQRDKLSKELAKEQEERKLQVERLEDQNVILEQENATLAQDKAALTELHELLYKAAAANETEDFETLKTLTAEIEPKLELLPPSAQARALLLIAIAANDDGDLEKTQEILQQLEPLKELLSPSDLEYWETLPVD